MVTMSIPSIPTDLEIPFSIKRSQSLWEKWRVWSVGEEMSTLSLEHLNVPNSREAIKNNQGMSKELGKPEEVPINKDWMTWALR